MKPVAAFAAGLWTGALVIAAIGLLYFQRWAGSISKPAVPAQDQWEAQLAGLNQENARLAAEAQRLRETVVELRRRPAAEAVRRIPFRRTPAAPDLAPWILESARNSDAQSLPKLEQAALQNNLDALDALAVLAEQDNAETLERVASSPALHSVSKQRAAQLLGATVELNPHAEELLLVLVRNDSSWALMAALGLETPRFVTRLGSVPPARVKTDPALRLRIVASLRAAVTDETVAVRLDEARATIAEHATTVDPP